VVPYYYFNPISWKNIDLFVYKKKDYVKQAKELLRKWLKPSILKGRQISKDS
jgi:hypothetical protein